MTDRYQLFATSQVGRVLVKRLGLPNPVPLRRHRPGQPVIDGPVLLGAADGGRLGKQVEEVLKGAQARIHTEPRPMSNGRSSTTYAALVFDATGITRSADLRALYEFFHPTLRALGPHARVIILGTTPEECVEVHERVAQRALEGFSRSVAKEMRNACTAQLVYVSPGAEGNLASTLRFLLSAKSAFVSGQVIRIGVGAVVEPANWDRPLDGRTALVTGASRGIGEAIAETLARDGAKVVCLDVPQAAQPLRAVAARLGGDVIELDVTEKSAGRRLAEHFAGGVDIVVHNAGITRDKTLAGMSARQWDSVIAVNLTSQETITESLLAADVLNPNGRIICVSSINGIAGSRGQANYAASKAGVIGLVGAYAGEIAARGGTINAVAPGFIETAMTARLPFGIREAGRRLNSLAQGGRPIDVAETIAWYANPASSGVNGNLVRVCGQSLLGA